MIPNGFGVPSLWKAEHSTAMTWQKDHPRRRGELEFHFANEALAANDDRVKRALARHDRRHPHESPPT